MANRRGSFKEWRLSDEAALAGLSFILSVVGAAYMLRRLLEHPHHLALWPGFLFAGLGNLLGGSVILLSCWRRGDPEDRRWQVRVACALLAILGSLLVIMSALAQELFHW